MKVLDCQGRIKLSDYSSVSYVLKNPVGGSYRVKDGNFQLYDVDGEGWRTIYAVGGAGVEQIALGGLETTAADELASCT